MEKQVIEDINSIVGIPKEAIGKPSHFPNRDDERRAWKKHLQQLREDLWKKSR